MKDRHGGRQALPLIRTGSCLAAVSCGAIVLAAFPLAGPGHGRAAAAAARPAAAHQAVRRPSPVTARDPRTVPGQPGVPQLPTTVFSGDFENRGSVPVRLPEYTGVTGMTYTADQPWLENCNGWVAQFNDPPGANPAVAAQVADCTPAPGGPGSTGITAWNNVRQLAQTLGTFHGMATPNANHAISAYTNGPVNNGNPGAGYTEFATAQPITLPANDRFLTFSVDVAELSCAANKNHAQLDFYLVNGAVSYPVTSAPIDPCTGGGTPLGNALVGTFTGDAPVKFHSTALGIKMINQQGSGDGNDHAFDNLRVLDVTPQLDKSFSPATAQAGGTSTLTFTITNTSDLLGKKNWSFTDQLPSGLTIASPSGASTTCPNGTVTAQDGGTSVGVAGGELNAGQASCTVSVTVTSATAASYTNDASNITSSGLNPPGSSTVTFTRASDIGLVKSVSPDWFSAAGQTLHYSFLVTDPDTVDLSGITVTDTGLPGLSPIVCPQSTLTPRASMTCTATYLTTEADVRAGVISNAATATSTDPDGSTVTSPPSTVRVPSVADSIRLVKTATPRTFSAAGQPITFGYLVTNTSHVIMSSIKVNDATPPGLSPVTCQLSVLGPGESERCFATYHTTAADLARGSVTDTAVAQGTPPGATVPVTSNFSTATAHAERPVTPRPAITLRKSATPGFFDRPGQTIRYSYRITNTGNAHLTRVAVSDTLPGLSAVRCPATMLAAGASENCTATYRITSADMRTGSVTNRAVAAGTSPSGRRVTSAVAAVTIRELAPVTG